MASNTTGMDRAAVPKYRKLVDGTKSSRGWDDEAWNKKFELLCAFYRANRHCRVPQEFRVEGVKLGHWVSHQRHYYKNHIKGHGQACITQERIDRLNSIGFDWSLEQGKEVNTYHDDRWTENYELLLKFHRTNGHFCVPYGFKAGSDWLGRWVADQRRFFRNMMSGKGRALITADRIAKLNAIGFDWDPTMINDKPAQQNTQNDEFAADGKYAAEWNLWFQRYSQMQRQEDYSQERKTSKQALEQWADEQRKQYKRFFDGKTATISWDHIEKLNSIGFDFKWSESFDPFPYHA